MVKDGHFAIAFIEKPTVSPDAKTPVDSVTGVAHEIPLNHNGHHIATDTIADSADSMNTPLPFIVDPSVVFGEDTSLTHPEGFYAADFGTGADSFEKYMQQPEGTTSRTPCAFAGTTLKLAPGQSAKITMVIGHSKSLETLVGEIVPQIIVPGFSTTNREAGRRNIADITDRISTSTLSLFVLLLYALLIHIH